MIIEAIKTIDGQLVTQMFPENEEDEKILRKMENEGNLEVIDGFQSDD